MPADAGSIEVRDGDLARLFMRLAAIKSPSREEAAVIAEVRGFLEDLELEVYEDEAGNGFGGGSGNLWCRVPGVTERPLVTLGAHLDTVQPTDEIVPEERNGVIVNTRPTILGADNKVAVASLLYVTSLLRRAEAPHPTYDLFLSVGEEIGLQGAKHMDVSRLESKVAIVFDSVGPVGGVVTEAPSQETMVVVYKGKAAHAGLEPEKGINAIRAAALALAEMPMGRIDDETTANVGRIEGGVAGNIVAEQCTVTAECRSLDEIKLGQVVADMVAAFQSGAARTGCEIEIDLRHEYRAFSIGPRKTVLKLVRDAMEGLGIQPELHGSGGGSDANLFNERGVQAVNLDCGMEAVHTSEETVTVDQLGRVARLALEIIRKAPEHVS